MTTDRHQFDILGRNIGTATGWDEAGNFGLTLYGLHPVQGLDIPSGDMFIDFESGQFESYGADGSAIAGGDIVSIIAQLPVKKAV